jgi:hypothetical protein
LERSFVVGVLWFIVLAARAAGDRVDEQIEQDARQREETQEGN